MDRLKPGDRVNCHVLSSTIVSLYKEYDAVHTFEVVAVNENGLYLFVPIYLIINGSSIADEAKCSRLGIDKRFLGEQIIFVLEGIIVGVSSVMDGMSCRKCHEFFGMAKANQKDGTLLCWACRKYPYR